MNKRKILLLFLFLPFYFLLFSATESMNRKLILAISRGDYLNVKKLITEGADINYTYHKGKSTLHWAVSSGNLKIIALLILKGARIDATDDYGVTPLQFTAITRNLDAAKLLIQYGADPWHKDKNGWSVMHYFVYYEFDLGVKYLLTLGVNPTNKSTRDYLDIPKDSTPLDIAYRKGNESIINILENPYKYLSLSKRPILLYGLEVITDEKEGISPYTKGKLVFHLTNLGREDLNSINIVIEEISNTSGLVVEKQKTLTLFSGEIKNLEFLINGTIEITNDENAFYQATLCYDSQTNRIPLIIKKKYKPFPIPSLYALFDQPLELTEGEATNIEFRLENKGGGELEVSSLEIKLPAGIFATNSFHFENLSIPPKSHTNVGVSLSFLSNVEENKMKNKLYGVIDFFSPTTNFTNYFPLIVNPIPLPEFIILSEYEAKEISEIKVGENSNTDNIINLIISNKTEIEGKDLFLSIESITDTTNIYKYRVKKFPPFLSLKISVSFETNEIMKTIITEMKYKEKVLLYTNTTLTNKLLTYQESKENKTNVYVQDEETKEN